MQQNISVYSRLAFRHTSSSFVMIAILGLLLFPSLLSATTITDDAEQTIEFAKPFSRIISLYPAHTENLAAMGAASLLVGISSSDDYPEEVLSLRKFSYREDPEKFIATRPDLVIIRPMIQRSHPEFVAKLQNAGITVVSLQPNNAGDMFSYWKKLGMLCGRQEQVDQMIASFQEEMTRLKEDVLRKYPGKRPVVYFEAIHTKMKTIAPDSIAALALNIAGAVNIGESADQVRQTNIGYFGKEKLLGLGEKVDFYLAQVGRMNPVTVETIANEPGFKAIRAVREGKIYLLEEQLVSRPTTRILDGVRELIHILYEQPQSAN